MGQAKADMAAIRFVPILVTAYSLAFYLLTCLNLPTLVSL